MADNIKLRNGTASAWDSADPTLLIGERGLETDTLLAKTGDGSTTWKNLPYDNYGLSATKSANYTILDDDANWFDVTTGAGDDTLTLPTLADNQDRVIGVRKADSAAGALILDGEGAEEIDGSTTLTVHTQGAIIIVRAGPNEWEVLSFTGGEPATNAVRVVAEYLFSEDNELNYDSSFSDGMAAATITFTELPKNTIAIYVYVNLVETGTDVQFAWKRSSGGTLVMSLRSLFADGGSNRKAAPYWLPTENNTLRVTTVAADGGLNFRIIGYKVGQS